MLLKKKTQIDHKSKKGKKKFNIFNHGEIANEN